MKHSKSTKAIALLMSMTMITSVFVGNTLSRYVTSVSSTDSARVAVWGINAGEDTVMNLFSEDYIVADKTIAASNTDGEKIMAPGTAGEAPFSIINFEQDVAPEVAYEVKISLDDSAIDEKILNNPSVQWKLDSGAFGTWDQLKTAILSLSGNAAGRHVYGPGEFATAFHDAQEHKISWQWLLDNDETITVDEVSMSSNEYDTYMGNLALTNDLNAVIKVSITAQQVNDLITNEYILDGADQTVDLNDVHPITIRSSADFSTFEGVEVNHQPLTRDVDYTAEEGSTVITLKTEYLSQLAVGTYTIDIISNDIVATTKFEAVKDNNNIIDRYNMAVNSTFETWYDMEITKYEGENVRVTSAMGNSGIASLKAFGETNQSFVQTINTLNAGTYYVAAKVRVDRYVSGKAGIGVKINSDNLEPIATISNVTNEEFVTVSNLFTLDSSKVVSFIYGTFDSANIDAFIDDIVILPLSVFDEIPTKDELDKQYEKYTSLAADLYNIDKTNVALFVSKMNEKAIELGMTNTTYNNPAGINAGKTTARDHMKLMVEASKNQKLETIWSKESKNIDVMGANARNILLQNTFVNQEFKTSYPVYGSKTGSWGTLYNLSVIADVNGNKVVGVVLNANSKENRDAAIKELFDISSRILTNDDYDSSVDSVVNATSAIACLVTNDGYEVLFEQNADEQYLSASLTKVMTSVVAFDYIENMNDTMYLKTTDIYTGDIYVRVFAGDTFTIENALYVMMLPSSNKVAYAMGRTIAEKYLN